MNRTALSLFSGAGGMDVGVLQAGFEILACIEQDPFCNETLRSATKREGRSTRVIEEDIRSTEPAKLMRELSLESGELDLLFGGPPCQAFSQIGKQGALSDERGLLLFEMVRYAEIFRPRTVFIEQVTGLLSARDEKGRRGAVLQKLLDGLQALGYTISWKVINSADYGVPQLRKRVFIVANLGEQVFQFPEPTHGIEGDSITLFALEPYATVGEAIRDLFPPCPKTADLPENSHVDVTPAGDRRRIHGVPEGSFLAAQTHLPKEQVGKLTRKDTTKFLRASRYRPANTLRGGEVFFHPTEDRYLTPREYLRIHGYPDDYLLKGPVRGRSGSYKYLDQHRQVANSVPPPVAKAIAAEIERIFRSECQKYSRYSGTG